MGKYENFNYIKCEDFDEDNPPVRDDMDLMDALMKVSLPWLLGPEACVVVSFGGVVMGLGVCGCGLWMCVCEFWECGCGFKGVVLGLGRCGCEFWSVVVASEVWL